ncbi:hypothetical protein E2562_019437 [Oryza meyeriana var. granulata]|uniref:Uncharacterized protein n=1 Tax=Oryza meyeriana var. granulata TaxID=110450 RepID=A0A6G1DK85_9ORYZ|nr:hypothetical protein E2562_019437 [Oryza meyeriana var. granulata]
MKASRFVGSPRRRPPPSSPRRLPGDGGLTTPPLNRNALASTSSPSACLRHGRPFQGPPHRARRRRVRAA